MNLRSQQTSCFVLFLGSVFLGILLYLPLYNVHMKQFLQSSPNERVDHQLLYNKWLVTKNVSYVNLTDFYNHKLGKHKIIKESDYLKQKEVRLICVVIVTNREKPFYEAISKTWGVRCLRTLYFSTSTLKGISAQDQVVVTSSQDIESWSAFHEILHYLYTKKELKVFTWYYLVSDRTYMVVENLIYYLCVLKSVEAYYLGHLMRAALVSYNSLAPGFVLSQMALHKINNALLKGQCSYSNIAGDIGLGSCLSEVGVVAMDTRDHAGRGRFLMYPPESLLVPGWLKFSQRYWDNSVYLSPEGPDCCSDNAISFYNMDVNRMYVMEYLVNHLRPYRTTNTPEMNRVLKQGT